MKSLTPNIIAILFIGIIFIGLISTFIIFLNQRSEDNNDLDIILPEEKILDINQQIKEIKSIEEKRLGGVTNLKPFDDRNYAYDERTADFRLVCTNPCPVSENILNQEFAAISYSISVLRGLTKSDIDESLMPFEVHASEDERCEIDERAMAYKTSLFDDNFHHRGLLCFFFDKRDYNRDKFPYSTSVHEVTHLFEENKLPRDSNLEGHSVIWEGLSEMMDSFFLKGNEKNSFCWGGNDWWGEEQYYNPNDAHGTGKQLFFELCNQYGLDYDDLPELFDGLEKEEGDIEMIEFIEIINNIVGRDTTQLFRNAGVI